MDKTAPGASDLADAAAVVAAREEVIAALGPLAACPLDVRAVEAMRAALARISSPALRAALARLECVAISAVPLRALAGGRA